MNSRMGFVASLFGVLIGDEFNIINGAGVDMGTYWFTEHGVAPANSRNTDAYVLQELLNGSYRIKKGLKYD